MKRVADKTSVPASPKKRRAELLAENRKALAAVKQEISKKITVLLFTLLCLLQFITMLFCLKKTLSPTTSTKPYLFVNGNCSFNEIPNKELCLTCEFLNDKIKVMEKRISICESMLLKNLFF